MGLRSLRGVRVPGLSGWVNPLSKLERKFEMSWMSTTNHTFWHSSGTADPTPFNFGTLRLTKPPTSRIRGQCSCGVIGHLSFDADEVSKSASLFSFTLTLSLLSTICLHCKCFFGTYYALQTSSSSYPMAKKCFP